MTARLTYLALFLAGAALFWFASERPVEALAAYLVCTSILALIEWAERRGTLSEPTWHGRREWADDAKVISLHKPDRAVELQPNPSAGMNPFPAQPGHWAKPYPEGDSHDHAV